MTDRPLLQARKHSERPHVLIVSDDPSLIDFLNEGLPLGGFWTTVISSGLQALEVFRLRQFDLVVVDAGLRSFQWLEFVRRLRGVSNRDTNQVARTGAPIVIVSETQMPLLSKDRELLGIDRELTAPLELDEVVVALHAVFDSWRARYPSLPLSDDPRREG